MTVIFGNFYTKREEFLTFKTGIPGGLDPNTSIFPGWEGKTPSPHPTPRRPSILAPSALDLLFLIFIILVVSRCYHIFETLRLC